MMVNDESQGGRPLLLDLPVGILKNITSYLAAPTSPSRILFAVALADVSQDDDTLSYGMRYSAAITGDNDWDTLDFGEIEKNLAARLSDDDLSSVLMHIDAVHNVNKLKLTNCINFTGAGLRPLRGSTIIEQIDLSLVGDGENPRLNPEPPISCDAVLPILDSIIELEGRCALKRLDVPFKWYTDESDSDSAFHLFAERYNEMWDNRETIRCLNCNEYLPQDRFISFDDYHGSHSFTCYQCTKHYCNECPEDEDGDLLGYCNNCNRDYCRECVKVSRCQGCNKNICENCLRFECNKCNQTICSACANAFVCSYCDVAHCITCNRREGMEMVCFCYRCRKSCCNSCRLRLYQEGNSDCIDCIKLLPNEVLKVMVEYSSKMKQELEELKNEARELKLENKALKVENKELKDTQTKFMIETEDDDSFLERRREVGVSTSSEDAA